MFSLKKEIFDFGLFGFESDAGLSELDILNG